MQRWSNHNTLLPKMRRRPDRLDAAAPAGETAGATNRPLTESDTSRSGEFLEFAQAAGGFGVFELNLVTGHIRGTSLFFELIGLECRDMSLTREGWTGRGTDREARRRQRAIAPSWLKRWPLN